MGVNKVDLATGETLIDLTQDSVTPSTLAKGVTAHSADGESIVGKMVVGGSGGASEGLIYTLSPDDEYVVTSIGTCTDTDVVIPKTHEGLPVVGIGYEAFNRNHTVKSVIIPDSVRYIGSFAFAYTEIEKVYIPDSVTMIIQSAFSMSNNLTVYCEAESKPEGWEEYWNSNCPVVWNAVNDIWEINDRFNSLPSQGSVSMPIIRFIGLRGNNILNANEFAPTSIDFTVEIIDGSVQVGDTLQICGMRTFGASAKNPAKKRKLRRFAEYVITEDDLDNRVLTLTVNPYKNAFAHLGHNNRQGGGPTTIYFRIRRPIGQLQNNDSGMTIDAKFSNVVPVPMMYAWLGEDQDGNMPLFVKPI